MFSKEESNMIYVLVGIGIFVVLLSFFVINFYNRIVRLKNNIERSWANIDVLLKQRSDEIPNLVNTVKGYAKHEKSLLTELTQKREQMLQQDTVTDKAKADIEIKETLKTLFARAENYPDLKANENFLKLQERISELETIIADRREFFNDSVTTYNIRIQQFPNNILANMFKYKKKEVFNTEQQDLNIKF